MDFPAKETLKGRLLDNAALGAYSNGYVNIAANVADTETVVIGADTYEFDDDSTYTAGNIQVDVSGGLTPASATDALITAINANGNSPVTAVDIDANTVLLLCKEIGTLSVTCSETMAGAGNTVTSVLGGKERVLGNVLYHVPTAAEVTAGSVVLALDKVPLLATVAVATTATGAAVNWDGSITVDFANQLLTIDNGGATDWAATDTLIVEVK